MSETTVVPVAEEIARALRALDVEDLKLRHAITPLGTGEERVRLTLEYVSDPAMSPLTRRSCRHATHTRTPERRARAVSGSG